MARGHVVCILLLFILLLQVLVHCLRGQKPKKWPGKWLDPAFIKQMVNEHNRIRILVNPPAANMRHMTWDEDLAKSACSWARECTPGPDPHLIIPGMAHPTFKFLGSNIWFANQSVGNSPVAMWNSEARDYNYTKNECAPSKVCGHYKQMVSAQTYKVGCSVELCGNLKGYHTGIIRFVVCNYGPIGNYEEERPYKAGKACSACTEPGDRCKTGLCRNRNRDGHTTGRSDWSPPWVCSASPSRAHLASAAFAFTAIYLDFFA